MYEAASKNYREVERALTQVERAITSAIKRNDGTSVQALTGVQLLLVSVKAEARLIRVLNTPKGLTEAQRSRVLAEDQAIERWRRVVGDAFRRHYRVQTSSKLVDALDHDVLAKYNTLSSLIDNELLLIISLRNKLAHGQWVMPFNAGLTAVESSAVGALRAENTLSLRYRDRLLAQMGNIVGDLVVTAPGFEANFNKYFLKIRRYRQLLGHMDYRAWEAEIRQRKADLARVPPLATPASD